jgi:hypothetical protein
MSHRQFTDSTGRIWDVWDVHPTVAANSLAIYRHTEAAEARDPRKAVAPSLADGWLCFEHVAERRRLAPIPPGWTELPTPELERLRDAAVRVRTLDERGRGANGERQPGLGVA